MQKNTVLTMLRMVMRVQNRAEKKLKKEEAPLELVTLSASMTHPLASAKSAMDQMAKNPMARKCKI